MHATRVLILSGGICQQPWARPLPLEQDNERPLFITAPQVSDLLPWSQRPQRVKQVLSRVSKGNAQMDGSSITVPSSY